MSETLWGFDETTHEPKRVRINSSGHLLADVRSTTTPAGADAVYDRTKTLNAFQVAVVTADGTIDTGAGYVAGYVVTAGTNPTIVLYDNTAASGTVLYPNPATALAIGSIVTFPAPLPYSIGLHADIGGTGSPTFNVLYLPS